MIIYIDTKNYNLVLCNLLNKQEKYYYVGY